MIFTVETANISILEDAIYYICGKINTNTGICGAYDKILTKIIYFPPAIPKIQFNQ